MSKHTPGPWTEDVDTHDEEGQLAEPEPNGHIMGPDGGTIALVYRRNNTALVKAAPEMLEALKECASKLEGIISLPWGQTDDNKRVYSLAMDALARAEGRK